MSAMFADEIFNTLFDISKNYTVLPKYNVYKKASGYTLVIGLAGYKKEDISVKVDKTQLEISSKGSSMEFSSDKVYSQNMNVGPFKMAFTIDKTASVLGKMSEGLLTVNIEYPEKKEDNSVKNIEIA